LGEEGACLDETVPSPPDRLDRLLLLDIGGVLLENVLEHKWWQRLALRSGRPVGELEQIFTNDLKPALWTGRMPISEFWGRLATVVDPNNPGLPRELEDELAADLRPLPAISRVAEWVCYVHVGLLSNHVSEWLDPYITRFRLQAACDSILVSDQTGLRKPDPRAFQGALDQWQHPPDTVLCADDSETNLAVASQLGMATLLAAPPGRWEGQVDRWIEEIRAGTGESAGNLDG
jgi:putative hydrolase of the HAD superfamily